MPNLFHHIVTLTKTFFNFCDSRNNIEIGRQRFFQPTLFVIRVPTEKDSDILFGSEYKREI